MKQTSFPKTPISAHKNFRERILKTSSVVGFSGNAILLASLLTLTLYSSPLSAMDCPQPRKTQKAPDEIYKKVNPLDSTMENVLMGKALFEEKAKPRACKLCHGLKGDGRGPLSVQLNPKPRDFTCANTIGDVPDGQLFWIIRNGSPGTGMPAFSKLEDEEIWQLILYIRKLAQSRIAEVSAKLSFSAAGYRGKLKTPLRLLSICSRDS